jgi:hypothetical protein
MPRNVIITLNATSFSHKKRIIQTTDNADHQCIGDAKLRIGGDWLK